MRDINDTVEAIYTMARFDPRYAAGGRYRKPTSHDPQLYEKIYAEVRALLVDQLMSVANALAPEAEDEVRIVNWLQSRLAGLAEQLPKTTERSESAKESTE